MLPVNIYLFILLIIALLMIGFAIFSYIKMMKDYFNQPEDKTGLYDFIHIRDNIINVDSIVNIKRIESIQEDEFKIIIELNDNGEPITFDFDSWRECNAVFEQIMTALDAADIVTD